MDNLKEWSENIKNSLSLSQVKDLLFALGADPIEKAEMLIARTICHGGESHKLYYYDNTKLFRCYTECSDIFDIYDLVIKHQQTQGKEMTLYQSIQFVANFFGLTFSANDIINNEEEPSD